jgi:valyl-tRNA synthetase
MQELVRAVREVRNRYQVDSQQRLTVVAKCSQAVAMDFAALAPFIGPLARIDSFEAGPVVDKPKQSATIVHPDFEAYVGLAGLIDPAAELKRGEKQLADMRKQLAGLTAKLGNESYRKNAPAEVVKETEDKVTEIEGQIRVLEQTLKDLQEG